MTAPQPTAEQREAARAWMDEFYRRDRYSVIGIHDIAALLCAREQALRERCERAEGDAADWRERHATLWLAHHTAQCDLATVRAERERLRAALVRITPDLQRMGSALSAFDKDDNRRAAFRALAQVALDALAAGEGGGDEAASGAALTAKKAERAGSRPEPSPVNAGSVQEAQAATPPSPSAREQELEAQVAMLREVMTQVLKWLEGPIAGDSGDAAAAVLLSIKSALMNTSANALAYEDYVWSQGYDTGIKALAATEQTAREHDQRIRTDERARIREFIELELDPALATERRRVIEDCAEFVEGWTRFGSGRNNCRELAAAIRARGQG